MNTTIQRKNGIRFMFDADNERHLKVASRYLAAIKRREGAPIVKYQSQTGALVARTLPRRPRKDGHQ